MTNINKYLLKKSGKLLLSDYQIEILKKYNIDFQSCKNLREVIMLIDLFINNNLDLENEEIEELDQLAMDVNERNYYLNNKA